MRKRSLVESFSFATVEFSGLLVVGEYIPVGLMRRMVKKLLGRWECGLSDGLLGHQGQKVLDNGHRAGLTDTNLQLQNMVRFRRPS